MKLLNIFWINYFRTYAFTLIQKSVHFTEINWIVICVCFFFHFAKDKLNKLCLMSICQGIHAWIIIASNFNLNWLSKAILNPISHLLQLCIARLIHLFPKKCINSIPVIPAIAWSSFPGRSVWRRLSEVLQSRWSNSQAPTFDPEWVGPLLAKDSSAGMEQGSRCSRTVPEEEVTTNAWG